MNKKPRFCHLTVFLASILLSIPSVLEGSDHTLTGVITDKTTGQPIPDANIILENTSRGTASGDGGYYFLKNIPTGCYNVTVRVMGYQTQSKSNIRIREKTVLNFTLVPQAIHLNPLIVTATRTDHLRNRIPTATEVYDTPRLQNTPGLTAGDVLETATGIFIKDNGGLAGVKSVSIRGSDEAQVKILLDGIPLSTAQFAGFDLNTLQTGSIERIEIIRGGHSALLGSEAIGGAIHLFTRENLHPRGFSYGLRSSVGSHQTRGIHGFGSHRLGPCALFLTYDYTESEGNFTFKDPQTGSSLSRQNNDFKSNNLMLKTQFETGNRGFVRFLFQHLDSDRGVPGSLMWASLSARRQEKRNLFSLRIEQQLSLSWRLDAQAFYQKYHQDYQDPAAWIPTDSRHRNRIAGGHLTTHWSPCSFATVTLGGGVRYDKTESTDLGSHQRKNPYMLAQTEWKQPFQMMGRPAFWTLIPAVRWDSYSDVGGQISPKLGLLISSGETTFWGFRGNIGRSFRAPTFNDLYWPEDLYSRGNPDLEPERGTNADAGIFYQWKFSPVLRMELTYFSNRIEDLILWESGADWIWAPLNIGESSIRGVEYLLTLRFHQDRYRITVSPTWMKAEDRTPDSINFGNALIYRPELKLDVEAQASLGPLTLLVNYRKVGKRFTAADNSASLPSYQVFHTSLKTDIHLAEMMIYAKLSVKNLLNKSITMIEGYPIPGREVNFSVSVSY
jgi:outer membrane cobalamin receptor